MEGPKLTRPIPGWYPLALQLAMEDVPSRPIFVLSVVDERLGATPIRADAVGGALPRSGHLLTDTAVHFCAKLLNVSPGYLSVELAGNALAARVAVSDRVRPHGFTAEHLQGLVDQATDDLGVSLVLAEAQIPLLSVSLREAGLRMKQNAGYSVDMQRHLAQFQRLWLALDGQACRTVTFPAQPDDKFALLYTSLEAQGMAVRSGLSDTSAVLTAAQALTRVLHEGIAGVLVDWVPGDPGVLFLDRSGVAGAYVWSELAEWRLRSEWWSIGDNPYALTVPYAPHRSAMCIFTSNGAATQYAALLAHRTHGKPLPVRVMGRSELRHHCMYPNSAAMVINAGAATSVTIEGADMAAFWRPN